MSYFKSVLRLGILLLLLLGESAFPQFVIVNSEKLLYENDSVSAIGKCESESEEGEND